LPPEQVETMLDHRFVFDEGPLSIRR
jgi:hypothetical protein